MAEQINQKEQKISHVYIGEGKASSKPSEIKKPDTEYNRRMQEVFDVVSKEALVEREDARNTQAELALLTAETLTKKKSLWDTDEKIRGRKLPRKLERVMTFGLLASVSALMDFGGDAIIDRVVKNKNGLFTWRDKPPLLPFDEKNGNREAVKAGWEFLTDSLIGTFSDISVQEATNRKDIRFVSPLSDTLSKVGNIAIALAWPGKKKGMRQFINSVVNPSTIEAGIRAFATIPVGGAVVENAYVAVNKFLLQDNTFFPFGFDLGVTMLAAKAKFQKYNAQDT